MVVSEMTLKEQDQIKVSKLPLLEKIKRVFEKIKQSKNFVTKNEI